MFADNPINFKTATDRIMNHVRWFFAGGDDADREVVAAGGIFEVLTGKEQYSFANKYPATAELLARIMHDFGHISGPYGKTAMEDLLVFVEKSEVRPYLVKHTARMNPITPKFEWSKTERQLWEGRYSNWGAAIRQTAPTGFAWEIHGPPGALSEGRVRGLDGTLATAKSAADYALAQEIHGKRNPEMTEVEDLLRDEWDDGLDVYDAEQMLVLHGFSKRDAKRFAHTEWDKLPARIKREIWDSVAAGVPEEAYLAGAEMTYRLSAAANPKKKGVSLPEEPDGITPEWAIWFECDDEGYPEEDCMPDPKHRDHDKWHKKHVTYIGKRAKVKIDDLLRRKDIGSSDFYGEFEKRLIEQGYDVWNSDSRFEVYLPGEVPEEERVERPVRRPSRKKPSARGKLFEIEPDDIEDVWQYVDFDCISGQTPGEDCAPDLETEGGEARKRWNINNVTYIAQEIGGEVERKMKPLVFSYARDEFGESFLYERFADMLVADSYGVYNSDTKFLVWQPGEIPRGE